MSRHGPSLSDGVRRNNRKRNKFPLFEFGERDCDFCRRLKVDCGECLRLPLVNGHRRVPRVLMWLHVQQNVFGHPHYTPLWQFVQSEYGPLLNKSNRNCFVTGGTVFVECFRVRTSVYGVFEVRHYTEQRRTVQKALQNKSYQ